MKRIFGLRNISRIIVLMVAAIITASCTSNNPTGPSPTATAVPGPATVVATNYSTYTVYLNMDGGSNMTIVGGASVTFTATSNAKHTFGMPAFSTLGIQWSGCGVSYTCTTSTLAPGPHVIQVTYNAGFNCGGGDIEWICP